MRVDEGRYVAERIPGARFVELAGDDHFVAIDPDQILDVVEPFVREISGDAALDPEAVDERVLATVMVTDIVDSTATATRLGDRAWAELLERHLELVRSELARFRGEEIDAVGDGVLALFDGPARAIRCGQAIGAGLADLGLGVRVGVHTGEVERVDSVVRGIAVHLAARIAAAAAPGEVLVSATTRDLVAGSGLAFVDRGEHQLKGIPEPRRLFALTGQAAPGHWLFDAGFQPKTRESWPLFQRSAMNRTASTVCLTCRSRGRWRPSWMNEPKHIRKRS